MDNQAEETIPQMALAGYIAQEVEVPEPLGISMPVYALSEVVRERLVASIDACQDVQQAGLLLNEVKVEELDGKLALVRFPYIGEHDEVIDYQVFVEQLLGLVLGYGACCGWIQGCRIPGMRGGVCCCGWE